MKYGKQYTYDSCSFTQYIIYTAVKYIDMNNILHNTIYKNSSHCCRSKVIEKKKEINLAQV